MKRLPALPIAVTCLVNLEEIAADKPVRVAERSAKGFARMGRNGDARNERHRAREFAAS